MSELQAMKLALRNHLVEMVQRTFDPLAMMRHQLFQQVLDELDPDMPCSARTSDEAVKRFNQGHFILDCAGAYR